MICVSKSYLSPFSLSCLELIRIDLVYCLSEDFVSFEMIVWVSGIAMLAIELRIVRKL